MLPFSRETPDRLWLGFVNEAESQTASALTTRVLPILVVAGMVALVLSGGKRGGEPESPPPSSAAAARMQVAASGNQSVSPPEPEPVVPEPVSDFGPPVAPSKLPPAASASAEPKLTVRRRAKPKPLSPAATRRATRAARGLRGAVAEGRVLASEENFALATAGDERGWTDAESECSRLVVDGVGGWSLPSRGQAREIHRGKAAPRSAYWTRQRGPHGDTIYVYDPRTRRSAPWLDQEVAKVVCVQPRPRQGG